MTHEKLLLVEDHRANRELMRLLLEQRGFEVVTAEDGHQAIALCRENKPDLVLMDMNLPGISGWEATRTIKTEVSATLPIIALTAHVLPEERERAIAVGCDDFEVKPVDLEALTAKIKALIAG